MARRGRRRWLLPLLLSPLLLLLLFPRPWLDSAFVRRHLILYAAQHGVDLSYGRVTAFSWWSGVAVDRLRMRRGGITASLEHLTYLPADDLSVKRLGIEVSPGFFDAAKGEATSGQEAVALSLPPLAPRHIHIEQLDVTAPQGGYRGALEVSAHGMTVDAELRGQLRLHVADRTLSGAVETAFGIALPEGRLDISSFEFKQADAHLSAKGVEVTGLNGTPEASAASFAANLRIAPFAGLIGRWVRLPAGLQRLHLEGERLSYGSQTSGLLFRSLSLEGEDGSRFSLSGPVTWDRRQGSLIGSKGLSFQGVMGNPRLWGVPVAGSGRIDGELRGSLAMPGNRVARLHGLAMTSRVTLDGKQWRADLSVDSAQMRDDRLSIKGVEGRVAGDEALTLAGQRLPAGEYRLLLSDSQLSFAGRNGIDWREKGRVEAAMRGLPPLTLSIASNGSRRKGETVIDTLTIREPRLSAVATLQGVLADAGLDRRASRMHGRVSVEYLAGLRQWFETLPAIEGRAEMSWRAEGRSRGELYSDGRLRLSGLNVEHAGIALHGGELDLPFRQLLDLRHRAPEQGGGINPADLGRIGGAALPGVFSAGSFSAEGFRLDRLRLRLLCDEGVLSGKLEEGRLLDGDLAGYFQLAMPGTGQPYPDAFARLSLLHADTSRLLPERRAEESRLNLYGTLKSDGRHLSGRVSIPDIERGSMNDLIEWLDPQGKEAALNNVKRMMEKFGFAPSSADARLQSGYADIDVALRSRSGSEMKIPVHNLSVGHLLRR